MLAGDDHAAKSSTLAHQSEHILKACCIPVLNPASVQEYLDYGLHGFAMSRYASLWVGFKCVTDVVESGASVYIDPHRVQVKIPTDFVLPPGGLGIRWPDGILEQEARLLDYKVYAALAYVRANGLDRIVWDSPAGSRPARLGIITTGKSYGDTMQALADLGIDENVARDIGIRVYKVAMSWPLEPQGARKFAQGLEEILVVEEKRQLIEYQIKEELYDWRADQQAAARGGQVRRQRRMEPCRGPARRHLAAAGELRAFAGDHRQGDRRPPGKARHGPAAGRALPRAPRLSRIQGESAGAGRRS